MIKRLITLGTLFIVIISNAQIKGLTETGDEVLLYKNGTWKYISDSLNDITEITKNNKLFLKNNESTFLVKSRKTNIGIWLNPKEWSFSKAEADSPSEFKFKNKDKGIYGMLVAEKAVISIESLIDIAYNNALEAAPDTIITEKEYRNVNGLDVIMMKMKGTIQGVKFIYFGYYYSNPKGAYQLLTYTSQSEFKESEISMENFLNGITEN